MLLFGGKRIRTLGSELGQAIKGFKTGIGEEPTEKRSSEGAASSVKMVGEESIPS